MKSFLTITFALSLSVLTACSSQVTPETKAESVVVNSESETAVKAETPAAKVVEAPATGASQAQGASQSVGGRATMYVLKIAVSAAVSYFVTKAIVDAVKDDVTSDD